MNSILTWFFVILAVLCVSYGGAVFATGSGTSFFLVWIAGGIVFALAAWLIRRQLWGRIPFAARSVFFAALCVVLVLFFFVEVRIAGHFHDEGEADLDVLIVLGAQVKEDGPSVVLKYRLDRALSYLADNPDTVCIVSGGQGDNEPRTEASAMRDYLIGAGVDADRILTEETSRNTVQNIRNSMELFDPKKARVGILTNNFHLYRGVAIAKKQGIRRVCGIAAPSTLIYLPNNMVREFFGVMKDYFAGNLSGAAWDNKKS